MSTVRYIRGIDSAPQPPPYVFKDVSVSTFSLLARWATLQAVVRHQLNEPASGVCYEPIAPLVSLQVLRYQRMYSDCQPWKAMGYGTQHEVLFSIPVVRIEDGLPTDFALFVPYIWVDNPGSLIAGREMLGYPKMMGTISLPSGEPAYPMKLDAWVYREPGDKYGCHPLLEVTRTGEPTVPADAKIFPPLGAAEHLFATKEFGLKRDAVMDMITSPATPYSYGSVQLKEFPNASHEGQACYQAVTRSRATITKVWGEHPMDAAEVAIKQYCDVDIVRELGLVHQGGKVKAWHPVAFKCDMKIDDVRDLWCYGPEADEPDAECCWDPCSAERVAEAWSKCCLIPVQWWTAWWETWSRSLKTCAEPRSRKCRKHSCCS